MPIIASVLDRIENGVVRVLAFAAIAVVMAPLCLLGVALIPMVKFYEFFNGGWSSHEEHPRKKIQPVLKQAEWDYDQKIWREERAHLGYCRECFGAKKP